MRALGILGGSFDPIHLGHLIVARDAVEQFSLDRLFFVPAAQAPLKDRRPPGASAVDRLAMVRRAIAGEPCFGCLDVEVLAGGMSYTVDTVRWLRCQWPGVRFYCLIGVDQAAQLDRWRSIEELAVGVEFIVADRPGCLDPIPARGIPGLRQHRLEARAVAMSSTEVRQRLQQGLSIRYLIHETTAAYIQEHQLYRPKSSLETGVTPE